MQASNDEPAPITTEAVAVKEERTQQTKPLAPKARIKPKKRAWDAQRTPSLLRAASTTATPDEELNNELPEKLPNDGTSVVQEPSRSEAPPTPVITDEMQADNATNTSIRGMRMCTR